EGRISNYDLLDSLRTGAAKLESLRDEDLPPEVRKGGLTDRRDALMKLSHKRAPLLREAADLDRKRMAVLLRDISANTASFDYHLVALTRRHARRPRTVRYGAP